jgi:pimeloyl-ACP methyl ester carboxylesterase
MATFVLVHGGGHGGWCWKWAAAALRRDGHDVYAPTLTGFGERSHVAACVTSFRTLVEDVAQLIRFEDLHDVVLVGHSMGGVVTPRVAEEVADRIRRVVWLTAVVCADGESLRDAVPTTPWIAKAVTVGSDGTAHTDPDLILDAILQDGGPEQRAFVRERHLPYPPHALVEPGRLSAFLGLGLSTAYVTATRDRTIIPEAQERMAGRLPDSRRAAIDACHDCMVTHPVEVARILADVSA